MNVVIERCAGLDVHKKTVVACVRTPEGGRGKLRSRETRTFTTAMKGLEALRAWLGSHGVTDVAMESTGVYWRPVYAVLEGDFRLLLVNARHVKHVPGRKTDVRDGAWTAQLLECGLLKGSFVPPPEIRDLRDLTRLRKTLVEDRTAQVNRVGKILELVSVKLASVVSDIMGVTGRRILDAMIDGEEDPKVLANLARGSLRGKRKAASIGKGNSWLRKALAQVAWAAVRTKGCYYRALYHRKKGEGRLEEGHRRRPACHAGRDLAHVLDRLHPRGPRTGPLPAPRQGTPPAPPSQATRKDGRQRFRYRTRPPEPSRRCPALRSH